MSENDTTMPSGIPGSNGGLIQSPDINSAGKPTQRAIKDVPMMKAIVNSLIAAGRSQQIVNGRITAKYNAERPYDQVKLNSEGLGWRSNFTTKPLPQMIEKVAPRFEEAVNGLKYLTNSSLPAKYANATEKTEKFQDLVTKAIRSLDGWDTLVSDIALDNALFGYTTVAWLDTYEAMPQHFAQDVSWFPDGTKQRAALCQLALLREDYLPHELFAYIEDKESAEAVGWNIQNTIDTINKAAPDNLRGPLTGYTSTEKWYQDAQRELTTGSSYIAGASVITVYTLLVQEVTGKVSHYRLASEGATENLVEIYSKEDRFDSTSDCLTFFTFQKGNKKLKGSKGVGRDIYELAGMQDRMRNEVVDRGILSGKTFVQGDFKQLHKFKMSVVGSTVIVPTGWTFLEQKVDGNIDSFLKLDAYFTMLVDQLIGSVSPRTFQGDRVTKAEVDLFASREEEGKDARIARFLRQFVSMIGTMQRRLCDKDNTEPAAKELQEKLLEIMPREELDIISKQPAISTVMDLTPQQRQMVAAVVAEKRGNPLYNQRALELEDLSARVGSEFADKVLLPDEDPTEAAEQQRLQLMELGLLTQGQPVPVSPRDNDQIHLDVIMPAAEEVAKAILQGQSSTPVFEAVVQHIQEHVTNGLKKGVDKAGLTAAQNFLAQASQTIQQLKQLDAQAQHLSENGELPPPDSGQMPPPGAA